MKYDSALRAYTVKRIEEIEAADILVGIPCYYNEGTIRHVIRMVTHGLSKHNNDKKCVILIADGGSTDDTREAARNLKSNHGRKRSSPYTGDLQEKARPSDLSLRLPNV